MAIFRQTHLLTVQQITVPKVEALIERPSGALSAAVSKSKLWEAGSNGNAASAARVTH